MTAECPHGSGLPANVCACTLCRPDVATPPEVEGWSTDRPSNARPVTAPAPLVLSTSLIGRLLSDAVEVYEQLGELLAGHRTGAQSESVTGGGGVTKPLPIRDQVAEHRHQLVHDLRWWAGRADSQWWRGVISEDVAAMARVVDRLAGYLADDDRDTLRQVLLDWHRRARVLSDLPKLRSRLPLTAHAAMPNEGLDPELWVCEGVVHALIPADRDELVRLECGECRTRWDVTDLPQASGYRLSVADAARMVGVHRDTLYRWAKAGQLEVDAAGMVKLAAVMCAMGA